MSTLKKSIFALRFNLTRNKFHAYGGRRHACMARFRVLQHASSREINFTPTPVGVMLAWRVLQISQYAPSREISFTLTPVGVMLAWRVLEFCNMHLRVK